MGPLRPSLAGLELEYRVRLSLSKLWRAAESAVTSPVMQRRRVRFCGGAVGCVVRVSPPSSIVTICWMTMGVDGGRLSFPHAMPCAPPAPPPVRRMK